MSEVQVLLATMGRQDFSIAETMNIRCPAVIANQCGRDGLETMESPWGTWKMVSSSTRGVGVNRNIALFAADGDILLFADDDVVYNDDMPERVAEAFRARPDADMIFFGLDIIREGKLSEKRHFEKKRRRLWNAMRFGACTIAIRREAVERCNLSFHRLFGGGCMYSAGEDSLFIRSCFRSGLRVYSHDYVLGTCCKDTSSWFVGYNEKYFYDKGALVRCLFPRAHYLMAPYFAFRFKRQTDVPKMRRLKLILAGIKGCAHSQPYRDI